MKGKTTYFIALLVLAAGFTATAYTLRQRGNTVSDKNLPEPVHLLPDIVPTKPRELYIEYSGDIKNIRFSTTFINQGDAALELVGYHDPEQQRTRVTQKLFASDSTATERQVGEFVFHEGHDHWHTEKYIQFQLWSYNENLEPAELLATTEKMSFCIWDEEKQDFGLLNEAPERVYEGCNNSSQGISVGWSDTYTPDLEGQELDITNIPDGGYMVRTVVNPDNKILEKDYSNNVNAVFVVLSNDTITILDN